MKTVYFFLLLLLGHTAFTQITIDDTNMPADGDTFRYSIGILDTNILFNYQSGGADIKWDFDSLSPVRQRLLEYLKSSETPYSSSVSNRIAEKVADTLSFQEFQILDVYEFYKNDANSFSKDFRGASIPTGVPIPGFDKLKISPQYKDKDEIYQFPLDYLDRDSSTFEFEFSNTFPAAYYGSKGYRINEVDAWGELTTPFGTFDCIRLITDVVGYDTLSFNGNDFGIESHTREYKWLTTDFETPALSITGQVINDSVFIPAALQYRDSLRDIPGLFAPVAIFLADTTEVKPGADLIIRNLSISLIPTTYEWNISPSTFNFVGGTSATSSDSIIVVFSDTGLYDVQLIARNPDGVDTLTLFNYILVDGPTGLVKHKQAEHSNNFVLAPNPSKKGSHVIISTIDPVQINQLRIIDSSGKHISTQKIRRKGQNISINTPQKAGNYFIILETSKGSITKKMTVAP